MPNKYIKNISRFKKEIKNYRLSGLSIYDEQAWFRSLQRLIIAQPSEIDVAISFYRDSPSLIKLTEFDADKVTLISVVKNEKYRIAKFLRHYRSIGVEQFAIIDNGSDDGTREFLLEQNDVSLFSTDIEYTTNRREAWINRVMAYYGYNRWYIVVDSDELLTYVDIENHDIKSLIAWAENKKIQRIRGMLVDMYAESFKEFDNFETDPYSQTCYFDSNTYYEEQSTRLDIVRGGLRARIFDMPPMLTKYPVIQLKKGDVQGKSHFLYPYYKNVESKCYLALLHYKFLPQDFSRYREIAQKGNYYNGSIQYKKYVEKFDQIEENGSECELLYEGSVKYNNSMDLLHIEPLCAIEWKAL